jgi:arylsulfatase A-like enzyme
MRKIVYLTTLSVLAGLLTISCTQKRADTVGGVIPSKPNIVYILADDLGYGDISALNENAGWKTPNIDRLAQEGIQFTDAHSGSAVCTPTRYGILTGRYSWRSELKSGVTWSWDPPLIEENRLTVGGLLQEQGYATACVGKWHLGLGWQYHTAYKDSVDFSRPVHGGPVDLGFDYFFGIAASLDIPPYVYIENDMPTTVATKFTESNTEYGWWRRGLTGDDFEHEQVLPVLTEKAVGFIEAHMQSDGDKPFFLYFPLPAPHTPILPTIAFKGKSQTNPYGDFMLQVDATAGRVMDVLEKHGITDNTMVIFTSDNGASPQANFELLYQYGHNPSYRFRGHKADIYEGGHRVPFIVRWPARVGAGGVTDHLTCLTNLMATVADITGAGMPEAAGVDSHSILPVLTGEAPDGGSAIINHSVNGSFAIRNGAWKLILCPGSGGWSEPRPKEAVEAGLPPMQLYNLRADPGERTNLIDVYPEKADELKVLLAEYVRNGRSTPGLPQEYVHADNWPGLEWMEE